MLTKSMLVFAALFAVVYCGRVYPRQSFHFSPAAFNVAPTPFQRWPRVGEFFEIDEDEEQMPRQYESRPTPNRYYAPQETVKTRDVVETQDASSRGYFDDSILPKSIVLNEERSIESRFPFPTFSRPAFPFSGSFGIGEQNQQN